MKPVGTLLVAAAAMVVANLVGWWNPRDHVWVEEILYHPIAAILAVSVLGFGVILLRLADVQTWRPVLLLLFGSTLLLLGIAFVGRWMEEEEVITTVAVDNSDLVLTIRASWWGDGVEPPAFLYVETGAGLTSRRVRIAEVRAPWESVLISAALIDPGTISTSWSGAREGESRVAIDRDGLMSLRVDDDCRSPGAAENALPCLVLTSNDKPWPGS